MASRDHREPLCQREDTYIECWRNAWTSFGCQFIFSWNTRQNFVSTYVRICLHLFQRRWNRYNFKWNEFWINVILLCLLLRRLCIILLNHNFASRTPSHNDVKMTSKWLLKVTFISHDHFDVIVTCCSTWAIVSTKAYKNAFQVRYERWYELFFSLMWKCLSRLLGTCQHLYVDRFSRFSSVFSRHGWS